MGSALHVWNVRLGGLRMCASCDKDGANAAQRGGEATRQKAVVLSVLCWPGGQTGKPGDDVVCARHTSRGHQTSVLASEVGRGGGLGRYGDLEEDEEASDPAFPLTLLGT